MSDKEFVIAIITVVMGCSVLIAGISKMVDLIKSWINRNDSNIPDEQFNQLAKAFVEYKENSTQRIQHLEAIIADEDAGHESSKSQGTEASRQDIEIGDDRKPGQEQSEKDNNNLRNMLRE